MYTYCLFCETAKCGYVAKTAAQVLNCTAIYPKQVQHTRSGGKMVDIVHDLLPGYVFLYLENAPLDVVSLRSIQGIIRCRACRLAGRSIEALIDLAIRAS